VSHGHAKLEFPTRRIILDMDKCNKAHSLQPLLLSGDALLADDIKDYPS
jgi:hypothetical protein